MWFSLLMGFRLYFLCLKSFSVLNSDRFVAKSCHVAITDVRKCVMQAPVVTVPEQAAGNVHVGKLVSIVYTTYYCFQLVNYVLINVYNS